jgi:hypothetical protein
MAATTFSELGVRVEDGTVWTARLFAVDRERLGALAGAEAAVTADSGMHLSRATFHTLLAGPVGLVTGRRDAYALIMFADGGMHERKLNGKARIQAARQEAMKFNMLARAAAVRS